MTSYSVFDAHNFPIIHRYLVKLHIVPLPTDSFCFAHSLLRVELSLHTYSVSNRRKRSAYASRTHCSVTAVESNVVFIFISKKKTRIRLIYKIFWKINPWQKYFQKKVIIIRRNFRDFAGRFSPISSFNLESFLTVERFSFEIIVSFLFEDIFLFLNSWTRKWWRKYI